MHSVRKEVAGVSDQKDQTALDFGEASNVGILQHESAADANNHPDKKTAEKYEQEDAYGLEQAEDVQVAFGSSFFIPLCSLEQDDSNGIVQDRLAKDDSV